MSGSGSADGLPAEPPQPSGLRRIVGFTLLPALAAISPLVVLPVLADVVGPSGWSSAIAGESVGSFAAIALAYGWIAIGPAMVASGDGLARGRLYRQSLIVRGSMSAIALPFTVLISYAIAADGFGPLAALMGLQGALISISYTWFAVGLGRPGAIIAFDAVPRLAAALISAVAIANGAPSVVFPLGGILVTLIGTTVYTVRVLNEFPAPWPSRKEIPSLFRRNAPVAMNEAAMGAYSSVPVPLVTATSAAADAAGFATADKIVKLGLFVPLTLANAFQNWTGEAVGNTRARRIRFSLLSHAAIGSLGWLLLATVGSWASGVLFGAAFAPPELLFFVGLAFACFSLRTSMVRHVLFPDGRTAVVLRATLLASAVGLPLMIVGTMTVGAVAAAASYALIEALSMLFLLPATRRSYKFLIASV